LPTQTRPRPVRPPAPDGAGTASRRPRRGLPLRLGRWLWASPWRVVAGSALLSGVLHLLFLGGPLEPDEGGYLMVARAWQTAGPMLYGNFWVDRPPGLLVLFGLAGDLGTHGVRLLATLMAVLLVLAAGWAGWAAAGGRAARWSAVSAAALAASPLLGAHELDGELLAAPLVMLGVACMLHAVRRESPWQTRVLLAVLAGATSLYAVLVKQNFVDGLAFAAFLLLVVLLRAALPRRDVLRLAGAFTLGVAAVAAGLLFWAHQNERLGALWYAMYGFRVDAVSVLDTGPLTAPEDRLLALVGLGVAAGVLYLAVGVLAGLRRDLRRGGAVALAAAGTLFVEVVGVSLGASYWPHYLIQMVPMVALGCGMVGAGTGRAPVRLRRLVVLATVTTLVSAPVTAAVYAAQGNDATRVGSWLASSARPDDTVVVTYSHPNLVEASGLSSPYPYQWSLPVRTLDPHLSLLRRQVSGADAPTWVVQWDAFDAWELDASGRMAGAVADHYHRFADVCGHPVWLHDGVTRHAAALPADCNPAFGEG
jgi:hypothetical protein